MKPYLICFPLIFWVCISTGAIAQNFLKDDAPIAKSFYKRLKKAKIDSLLIYESGCVGCEQLADSSGSSLNNGAPYGVVSAYFIWKINGESFIKKFNYSTAFQTVKLKHPTQNLFDFYKNNMGLWNSDKDFRKSFSKLSFEEKFKLISPSPDHYGFDKICFKDYEFEVDDTFGIQKIDKSLFWIDRQKEWVANAELLITSEHITWQLETKKRN